MKMLKYSEWIEEEHFKIGYKWKEEPDCGYDFPCDKDGNIKTHEMHEAGLDNLRMCRADKGRTMYGPFREKRTTSYHQDAVGECDRCKTEVVLSMSLCNTCDKCGDEYNSSGQLLAAREFWGEDTGESISEIMQGNLPMGGDR